MLKLGLAKRRQAGLSIVELMVGIAIGLIVVAAATVLVSTQLAENRRLLLETQLQQDLRATADIVTRELRRAGAMPDRREALRGALSVETIWREGTLSNPQTSLPNGLAASLVLPSGGGVDFDYVPSDSAFVAGGYAFDLVNGVIRTSLGGGTAPQPLTDINVMRVNAFTITAATPAAAEAVRLPCPNLCPGTNDTACWPRVAVRELLVTIEAEAARDLQVKRAVTSRVRVRADRVTFSQPPLEICPP